jgi:hypothetical protein
MSEARRIRRKGERYVVKRTVAQIKREIASGGNREETITKYYKDALEQLKKTFDDTTTETDKEV